MIEFGNASPNHVSQQGYRDCQFKEGSGEVGPEVACTVLETVSQFNSFNSTINSIIDITCCFFILVRNFKRLFFHQKTVEFLQFVTSIKHFLKKFLHSKENQSYQ